MKIHTSSTHERDLPACVAENIQRLKKEQSISYAELARRAGATPSYLYKIANGERRRVSYAIIKNIASVLNVSVEELLDEGLRNTEDMEEQKHKIFLQLKTIVSSSQLTHREKLEQLKVIADVCQYILVKRF